MNRCTLVALRYPKGNAEYLPEARRRARDEVLLLSRVVIALGGDRAIEEEIGAICALPGYDGGLLTKLEPREQTQ